MKRKMLSLLSLVLIASTTVFAQSKTEKFEVKGKCGMCEKRIEKAANSVDGVTKASWDKDTQTATVIYDQSKTNLDKIEMAIAKAGHDTKMYKAPDAVYDKLPACCKYDRTESEKGKDGQKEHQD